MIGSDRSSGQEIVQRHEVRRFVTGIDVNRGLVTLWMSVLVTSAAAAQDRPISSTELPSIDTILSEWIEVHSGGDSLSYAIYVSDAPARTDTAEVYFNVDGQPRAWRAVVGGIRYAHVPTVGLFVVDDSLSDAFSVYATRRPLLEALELLQVIEARVKQPSD